VIVYGSGLWYKDKIITARHNILDAFIDKETGEEFPRVDIFFSSSPICGKCT